MKYLYVMAFCYACLRVALGGIIVSDLGSARASHAWDVDEWSAAARSLESAVSVWELSIGDDEAMSGFNLDMDWGGSETSLSFKLEDTGREDEVISIVNDGFSVSLQGYDAYIGISNTLLTIGGKASYTPDDFAVSSGESASRQYIHIRDSDGVLSDLDFVLEGKLNIDWSGAAPPKSQMAMYETITQIPEPASIAMVILVSLTGLFIRRRFK